jgi:hypothetical protein
MAGRRHLRARRADHGLHLADVEQLLALLDRLVDAGKSVIVIEHHQAVMAHADWIIDLGPGAGHDGGRVVFEGTPAELVAARSTLTGQHLAVPAARPRPPTLVRLTRPRDSRLSISGSMLWGVTRTARARLAFVKSSPS